MFAIECINKFYKYHRYVGLRDTNLPYLVYEGNSDCPKDIHDFQTKENAEKYLANFISRENIDVMKLGISEMVDIALVNNSNKFSILEYSIDNDKLVVVNEYPQDQFTRKEWWLSQ